MSTVAPLRLKCRATYRPLKPKQKKVFWFFFSKKNDFLTYSSCRRMKIQQPPSTADCTRTRSALAASSKSPI